MAKMLNMAGKKSFRHLFVLREGSEVGGSHGILYFVRGLSKRGCTSTALSWTELAAMGPFSGPFIGYLMGPLPLRSEKGGKWQWDADASHVASSLHNLTFTIHTQRRLVSPLRAPPADDGSGIRCVDIILRCRNVVSTPLSISPPSSTNARLAQKHSSPKNRQQRSSSTPGRSHRQRGDALAGHVSGPSRRGSTRRGGE